MAHSTKKTLGINMEEKLLKGLLHTSCRRNLRVKTPLRNSLLECHYFKTLALLAFVFRSISHLTVIQLRILYKVSGWSALGPWLLVLCSAGQSGGAERYSSTC